jgi:hypothetical protein
MLMPYPPMDVFHGTQNAPAYNPTPMPSPAYMDRTAQERYYPALPGNEHPQSQ